MCVCVCVCWEGVAENGDMQGSQCWRGGDKIWQSSTVGSTLKASISGTLPPNAALIGYATNVALLISAQLSTEVCEPVWPSGKAFGWQAEGPRLDSASALLSLQKGCGLWTLSCDFVPHN